MIGRLTAGRALIAATTTTGGSPTVVVAALVALFVAAILSAVLALRLYRGYRRTGGRARLFLAVGLVLLTTVPIGLRLVLTNVPGTTAATRELAVTGSQLLGLVVVLGVIYGGR